MQEKHVTRDERARRATPLAVYVHFPWCLAKCPYCDFVSYAKPRDAIDHEGYADAVGLELEGRAGTFEGREVRVESVFFGGGTPSLWRASALGRVLAAITARFDVAPDVEVTVECNPTSLDLDVANALADRGINRLSIGAQALRPEQLSYLGRLHDPAGALRAVEAALASRVPRVSADLIYGLPDQLASDAASQAHALASLGLTHLSCYELTIEAGTTFGELARAGRLPRADEGAVVESFFAIEETLARHGLEHYEISNYARPGDEARHNLAYWRGVEYLGLGCGAFGFLRTSSGGGVRYRNAALPERYAEGARRLPTPSSGREITGVEGTREALDAETLLRERIMLGLRLRAGFDLGAAAAELGAVSWTADRERGATRLVARGRLVREGDHLRVPPRAWLFANDVAAQLF
jgi:putative oxygen-independent coproporphyrinogen III oxidase